MSAISNIDFVTFGSVWVTGKGRNRFVLFLSNTQHTKPALQERFPPTVTYADEKGNTHAVGLDYFLESCEFHHVDPELESKLENLFTNPEQVPVEADPEVSVAEAVAEADQGSRRARRQSQSEEEFIEKLFDDGEQADSLEGIATAQEASALRAHNYLPVEFGLTDTQDDPRSEPLLAGEELTKLLRSYRSYPIVTGEVGNLSIPLIAHELTFAVSDALAAEVVTSSFDPNSATRTYDLLTIDGVTVPWELHIGTYKAMDVFGQYVIVTLAVADNTNADDMETFLDNEDSPLDPDEAEEAAEVIVAAEVDMPAAETQSEQPLPQDQPIDPVPTQNVNAPQQVNVGQAPAVQQAPVVQSAPVQQAPAMQQPARPIVTPQG